VPFPTRLLGLALVLSTLAGCANPGIVAMSSDTFMLSRVDKAGIFGNAAAMKADVMREASDFAKSKGKVAVPVEVHETPLLVGRQFASIDYQFRLVDPNDPAAHGAVLRPEPTRIETKTEAKVDVKTPEAKADYYAELLKLDDLHKRSIITDAEFEEQKQKILSNK